LLRLVHRPRASAAGPIVPNGRVEDAMRKIAIAALLGGYLVVLLDLTLVRYPQSRPPANWVPLGTIGPYCAVGGWELVRNVAGNVALFAPLGVLLPAWHAALRRGWRVVALALGVSLAIELAQYASGRRVADVDDVLLNTAGAALGCLAFAAARRARRGVVLAR
jgi:glycopeptide antibiotics resistance protein